MEKLHELLRVYIERSGYTIYGLAKESGINRSTLQKIVLGNMKLSKKEMNRILPYLRLARTEREQFMLLQETQEKGLNTVHQYESVFRFMKQVSELVSAYMTEAEEWEHNSDKGKSVYAQTDAEAENEVSSDMQFISGGRSAIIRCLKKCCLKESAGRNPLVVSNIPPGWDFFYEALREAGKASGRTVEVRHIVQLKKKKDRNALTEFLTVCTHMLPAVFLPGIDYRAFGFEGAANVGEDVKYSFPYYVSGAGRWNLLVDAKGTTALLIHDDPLNEYLRNLTELHQAQALPVGRAGEGAEELIARMQEMEQRGGICAIGAQPYMAPLLMPAHEKLGMDAQKKAEKGNDLRCVFTESGLRRFASSGRLDFQPDAGKQTYTPDERRILLERLFDTVAEDENGLHYRIINPQAFPVAEKFCVLSAPNTVLTAGFTEHSRNFRCASIADESFAEALSSFFDHMMGTHMCFGREKTMEIIQRCMERIPLGKC